MHFYIMVLSRNSPDVVVAWHCSCTASVLSVLSILSCVRLRRVTVSVTVLVTVPVTGMVTELVSAHTS